MGTHAYYPVPGSAELATRSRCEVDSLLAVVARGGQVELEGVVLQPVRVERATIALAVDVLDALARTISADALSVYLQLYAGSIGTGRNFCRSSVSTLAAKTGLTARMVNKGLAELVTGGHVKALQRTQGGTLFLVALPTDAREPMPATPRPMGRPDLPAPVPRGYSLSTLLKAHTLEDVADLHHQLFGDPPGRTREEIDAAVRRLAAAGVPSHRILVSFKSFVESKAASAGVDAWLADEMPAARLSDDEVRDIDDT